MYGYFCKIGLGNEGNHSSNEGRRKHTTKRFVYAADLVSLYLTLRCVQFLPFPKALADWRLKPWAKCHGVGIRDCYDRAPLESRVSEGDIKEISQHGSSLLNGFDVARKCVYSPVMSEGKLIRGNQMHLTLNTGEQYRVDPVDIQKWSELYPAVPVEQELNAMAGWLDANPTRRKTAKGIKRFINSWLARAQDKGGSPMAKQAKAKGLRGMGTLEELTELGWIPYDWLETTKEYFLQKYGCYHLNGTRHDR